MDKHDQLAKRMLESKESLSARRGSPILSPLEQLIAKVQVRWPYPEMGDLEYVDWRETLNLYPLTEIQAALDRLMRNPPKRDLADGTVTEYRGRPTLVDVTRTIDIMREERVAAAQRREWEKQAEEMRKLEARRAAGEKFYGLADVLRALPNPEKAAKPMPNVKTVWPDIDPDRNKQVLEQQKAALLASSGTPENPRKEQ